MHGLTSREVEERTQAGKVNYNANPVTRTYRQIIRSNTLTFFNFLNLVLFILIMAAGSYKNAFFIFTAIFNSLIGIIQEIRAKKTIDALAIMTQSRTVVLRDGRKWSLATDKLVVDDVIYLKAGDQVPADCELLEGSLEVNESLLTGEADNLSKQQGEELYSGSFVTSGEGCCKVLHVGSDNYAAKITSEAKEFKEHHSELRNSINAILKVISIIIIPIGALLFCKQYYWVGDTFRASVVSMVAGVLGMIPEGLVLLTSVTLTIGALTLALRKTLVQELYCIETLARVDTLCLDKTGTITEGSMKVEDFLPYADLSEIGDDGSVMGGEDLNAVAGPECDEGMGEEDSAAVGAIPELSLKTSVKYQQAGTMVHLDAEINEKTGMYAIPYLEKIMGNLMAVQKDENATADALHRRFRSRHDWKLRHVIDFSSDRKYSGAVFEEEGTFLIGAAQFLFPQGLPDLAERTREHAKDGFRVLVLAHSRYPAEGNEIPEGLTPVGLLLLTDVIREEAPDTLKYFYQQGVDLKVISGDDPITVSAIAKKAGLRDAENYVDATTITTEEEMQRAVAEYNVFGRVTPQQKKQMVLALQQQKHTVAMTGDGVNDVLALKEADCSIAMASGSDAAKNIANIVLMDSNFASMPEVVNQGRRVVNNIRMAASMFLIKTMFSVMLSLITIFFGDMYPFEPIQMTLISVCAVGIPTFLLSQENNFEKIDHTFLRHVFMNAFPAAITITGCVFSIIMICQNAYHSSVMLNTACVLVTGWNYMAALKTVYAPLNQFRKAIIYTMQVVFFAAAVIFQNLLSLKSLEFGMISVVFLLMTFSPILIDFITMWIRKIYAISLDQPDRKWYHAISDAFLGIHKTK